MNLNIHKYDDVNINQFPKASWIKANSVPPTAVKILLQRFNISGESINKMVPIINNQVQDGRMAASGQPYFIDFLDRTNDQIPFFESHRNTWGANRFFDKRDLRYNYQFIKEYQKAWYFNDNPRYQNQVGSFLEAVTNSGNGTYIYSDRNVYIPNRINNGFITFNRGDAMECNAIHPKLNQNRIINTNNYNKLVRKEYEKLWQYRQSMCIDRVSNTYRQEFMIQYKRTIPQYFWQDSSFDDLFDKENDLSTFMLLDNSCEYGAPIGVEKTTTSIILNDNTRIS